MSRQMLAVIAGAVVLFAAAVVSAMAFTSGDSSSGANVHTMPDGSVMTVPMSDGDSTMMDDDDGGSMMDDDDSMMDDDDSMMDDDESMMGDGMGMRP